MQISFVCVDVTQNGKITFHANQKLVGKKYLLSIYMMANNKDNSEKHMDFGREKQKPVAKPRTNSGYVEY